MTKEQIKELFKTDADLDENAFSNLIDFLEAQKGPKGDKGDAGAKGTNGAKGDTGTGVKSIALTTDESGAIVSGKCTLTDDQVIDITITKA